MPLASAWPIAATKRAGVGTASRSNRGGHRALLGPRDIVVGAG